MKQGKHICETLKAIRKDIAKANDIDYQPIECNHQGDCAGTCPACESETRWLERQLRSRQALGKAVLVAGLSLALSGMAAASPSSIPSDRKKPVSKSRTYSKKNKISKKNSRDLPIVGMVEDSIPRTSAEFPNGEKALLDSIDAYLSKISDKKNITEDYYCEVGFYVEKDGSIGNIIYIMNSTNPAIDKYIKEAIHFLPKFSKPAYNSKNQPVRSSYSLPVTIKVKEESKTEE
ncbi:MAG: hypothetical protein IK100_01590 [Muribaculaceae bacterium]|nr:hypothetical protein [Muribaculaceae bacterium]